LASRKDIVAVRGSHLREALMISTPRFPTRWQVVQIPGDSKLLDARPNLGRLTLR
jgi:hypothetical protein